MHRNERIHTKLTKAIADNDLSTLYTLSFNSNLEELNNYNETALFYALIADDISAVKILLEAGSDPCPLIISNSKWSPVAWASAFNQIEILELLIKFGADVNLPDGANIYPLEWAFRIIVNTGESKNYELLINAGADKSIIPNWDRKIARMLE